MKKILTLDFLTKVTRHEVFKYLVAGLITTVFYSILRIGVFPLLKNAIAASAIANVLAICFAFVLNDSYVFNQARLGRQERFIKFFIARLSTLALDIGLAFLLVDKFPGLIGQFVGNNLNWVNAIATLIGQVLIIVTNYFISKIFIFKNQKSLEQK